MSEPEPTMAELREELHAVVNEIARIRGMYAVIVDHEIGPLEAKREQIAQNMHSMAVLATFIGRVQPE